MIDFIKGNKSLLICLSIIFVSSFIASLVQSSFNKVEIELKELKTDNAQTLVYDLYKPKIATKKNEVPYEVVNPDFPRT